MTTNNGSLEYTFSCDFDERQVEKLPSIKQSELQARINVLGSVFSSPRWC